MVCPQFPIGVDHLRGARIIDRLEQAATDNLRGFIVSCRIEVGRLSARNAFKFRHRACEKLVLLGECVYALAVGSDRKRIHNRRARGALDRG